MFVTLKTDVANPRMREQIEDRVHHAEAGAQHRHHDHIGCENLAFGRFEGRVETRQRHRQLASRLDRQNETEPVRQPPELTRRRRAIAQRRQGILRDWMLHKMDRHAQNYTRKQ